ncbi:MAG: hypothetical protein J6S60_00540 [Oscillospiraceae bacterium]|nr:hypothetical protein [Oscillospiraceae bacterium]
MSEQDVAKIMLENARLRKNQLPHCRGCELLTVHPCGAFAWCPRLGAVDPDVDGCSKRRGEND